MMKYLGKELFFCDLECSGLLSDMKKQNKPRLHNFCSIQDTPSGMDISVYCRGGKSGLQTFLNSSPTLIIHNGILFDGEALSFFKYDVSKVNIVDTLLLSWYLEPKRPKHGLESYGEEFGVPKPVINDWESLTQEDYNHRVIEDCKIQRRLWMKQYAMLKEIYGTDEQIDRFLAYLMFKGKELLIQQRNQWKLDVDEAVQLEQQLSKEVEESLTALQKVMPKVPKYATKSRPAKPFKKSGELSSTGLAWKELTSSMGLPFEHSEPIKVKVGEVEPNAQSVAQIKAWLYSLGWVPQTFKAVKVEAGVYRDVEQINVQGGDVCKSVKELFDTEPGLVHLQGLGILKHRHSMVKGFLRDQEEGFLTARAAGFTNTLRLQHSETVNLPSLRVKYGKEIRGLLKTRSENNVLLGSDLCSLENRLLHHFQMPIDPEYVKTQLADDYDPHLQTALSAGMLTQDEVTFYKWYKENHE